MPKFTYDHQKIEQKWLDFWEKNQLFQGTGPAAGSAEGGIVEVDSAIDSVEGSSSKKALAKPTDERSVNNQPTDKMYLLFAFAYPSGSGLHVGHVESITALDIMARYYRMTGKDVFFPVGWDAFGLPAENYAIKTGIPPAKTTSDAIKTFRRQVKRVAISYDWQTEIATCHPGYYQWTQWLFKELYKNGLAYKDKGMVNWCPSCQTVLANEQVIEGQCERCDAQVVQKELNQWYFKISEYKDELIEGLKLVDWPEATKQQQINWIGRSRGVEVDFELKQTGQELTCFTTRIDTIYGATFLVISPEKFREMELLAQVQQQVEHKTGEQLLQGEVTKKQFKQVEQYLIKAFEKTEEERKIGEKEKTGVKTGLTAVNPVNNQEIPIFVADYVLSGVGTGVVMGVPAHDERDFEFAQKYNLEVVPTNKPSGAAVSQELVKKVMAGEKCWSGPGEMVNSGQFDGMDWKQAQAEIVAEFSDKMQPTTNYRLRDWLISRQRYWGAPIPVIYDPDGQPHLVKDEALPWKLPEDVDFKPTGESPLTSSEEFIKRAQNHAAKYFADLIEEKGWAPNGEGWRPEFDTMDTFVDSSWYYLRYIDPRNPNEFAKKDKLDNWLPVDFYLIGPEHIVLHLLYSRFFTKFLRDQGYLDLDSGEPFTKMRHQGMILGPDNKKMSKSKGNVINPDAIVGKYGADTLRVYEMFMGPLSADKPWDDRAVQGVRRFLDKVYNLVVSLVEAQIKEPSVVETVATDPQLQTKLHQTIKKVSQDIPGLKFNTAIAALMELSNEWRALAVADANESGSGNRNGNDSAIRASASPMSWQDTKVFVKLLAPFAPFMAEELWQRLGEEASIHQQTWPEFDPDLAKEEEVVIPVQVNGKLRGELVLAADELEQLSGQEVIRQAKQLDSVAKWLQAEDGQTDKQTGAEDRAGGKTSHAKPVKKDLKKEIYVPGRIVSLVV